MTEELMVLPSPQQLGEMNKKELTALAKTKAQQVTQSGTVSSLEAYTRLKKLSDFSAAMAKGMQGAAEKEARLEQEKGSFEKYGAKVTHTSGPSKWLYDNCGDPTYEYLMRQQEELKAIIKERETFLRNIPEAGMDWVDADGEVHQLRRAVRVEGAEGISITY